MFNESNTAQAFVQDLLTETAGGTRVIREAGATYERAALSHAASAVGWRSASIHDVPRTEAEVLVEPWLREALIRLNPEIAARPERVDEVLYRLRGHIQAVRDGGLVATNEAFTRWLRGEQTMPFGDNGDFTPVRLIDFNDPRANDLVVTTEWTYRAGTTEKRFDLVLLVNGIPLVIGEAKTPVRPAVSWVDGAAQVHDDYEEHVPAMFVPNVLSFATEGKTFRYGSIRMPIEIWAPWREGDEPSWGGLDEVRAAVTGLIRPETLLDILRSFTLFATDKRHRKIKVICRYQQYQATNQIVDRVVQGRIRKGLIWHFQGSGKSLLMVFAARKLRLHPALRNPTVLIVVDRIDLDTQITATFNASDVPNMVTADTRGELHRLLTQDSRKVIITTIHKFGEAEGVLNPNGNIIVLVDEAHRTQEGDYGRKMRDALPNAFLFGLTGTPINKRDHNTFWAFGAQEDEGGYLSRYSFEESIRDHATLPLHFEARLVQMRVDRGAIDQGFAAIGGDMSEDDQNTVGQRAARLGQLLKVPDRVRAVVADIATHYRARVEPNGFKGQIVVFDRESCVLYKQALDEIMPPEASAVVMTVGQGEDRWKAFARSSDEESRLLDHFRDPADQLKLLIVTAKLLTGFDAPILQAMYLDRPIKEHSLLQAICRVNRPFPNKTHGLVVDYLGVFDDVAAALDFDDRSVQQVISNLDELKADLPFRMAVCLERFAGVDRSVGGYEGLLAAQECFRSNEDRDAFAGDFSILSRLWEALSPDPVLTPFAEDYRWLSQIYESSRPPSGQGKLLWHALGAKTVDLINRNVHVETVRNDLDTIVLDADLLAEVLDRNDPEQAESIAIQLIARLRRNAGNPTFVALGQRLEDLKQRHEQGLVTSLAFLKQLLELARDTLTAEKDVDPAEEPNRGKAALTELFEEVKGVETPVIVERIVSEIDEIVRHVRYEGWQGTESGKREVKRALRRGLLKYKLHQDQELFDRAYGYIEQYY